MLFKWMHCLHGTHKVLKCLLLFCRSMESLYILEKIGLRLLQLSSEKSWRWQAFELDAVLAIYSAPHLHIKKRARQEFMDLAGTEENVLDVRMELSF